MQSLAGSYFQVQEDLVQQELAALLGHLVERPLYDGVAVGGCRELRVLPLQTVDGLSGGTAGTHTHNLMTLQRHSRAIKAPVEQQRRRALKKTTGVHFVNHSMASTSTLTP